MNTSAVERTQQILNGGDRATWLSTALAVVLDTSSPNVLRPAALEVLQACGIDPDAFQRDRGAGRGPTAAERRAAARRRSGLGRPARSGTAGPGSRECSRSRGDIVQDSLSRFKTAAYGGTSLDEAQAQAVLRAAGFTHVMTAPTPPGAPAITIGRTPR